MPSHVVKPLHPEVLRGWPLPLPSRHADKEERGRVLVIGGSPEMPGAAILAATAALRAGAGKLQIATCASVAQLVALAIPESRVIALPETADGGIDAAGIGKLDAPLARADAVLVGPGMQDDEAIRAFVNALLPRLGNCRVVLDAGAMNALPGSAVEQSAGNLPVALDALQAIDIRGLITPHAGEMAHLLGIGKEAVVADPYGAARKAAQRWGVMVALKGATTVIAAPNGRMWKHEGGNAGLATSGSGDILAGVIAGLVARGAPLDQACAWGVTLHAQAGEALNERFGPIGFLAGELAAEIPRLMHAFGTPG